MTAVLDRPELIERARAAASSVVDPELPMLSLVDLGVLREVAVDQTGAVVVAQTTTKKRGPAKATMRAHAASCAGSYMPVQPSEMRPSGETHVISVITRPAPPNARLPRCTR